MIDPAIRRAVITRARGRCEYCLLSQDSHSWPFHVEHVLPRQHGGDDSLDNLALACPRCNRYKGPNLSGIDPATGQLTPLYNPRTQNWTDHFRVVDSLIEGLTAVGRTTARLFTMNAENREDLRSEIEQA